MFDYVFKPHAIDGFLKMQGQYWLAAMSTDLIFFCQGQILQDKMSENLFWFQKL